jgi:hypothetical protein
LSVLQKRVETLEAAAAGEDGGCGRCRGVLVVVKSACGGALHSARWNSEALTEDELGDLQAEAKCPRCGRDLRGDAEMVVKVGGKEGARKRA